MLGHPLALVLQHVRRLVGPVPPDWTDAHLLERFAAGRDEAAFAALVDRHAPLVWSVCRRILRHDQDAEDAFQATFLVLARKATSVRQSLGGWLHEVAYNAAQKARISAARRREREARTAGSNARQTADEAMLPELRGVLDEELRRLPAKYRQALVLCYLEGKTNEQAASELGWPAGSMSKRLARGRELLRARLTKRGFALAAGGVVPLFADEAVAGVSTRLLDSTVRNAVATTANKVVVPTEANLLAKRVLQSLWIHRLTKVGGVLLILCVLGTISGVVWRRASSNEGPPLTSRDDEEDARAKDIHEPARLHQWEIGYAGMLAFTPDGKRLICAAHDTVHTWDIARGVELLKWDKRDDRFRWRAIALSANGERVAMLEGRDRTHVVEVASGKELSQLKNNRDLYSIAVALSPDGKLLAANVAGDFAGGPGNFRLRLRLWDTFTGEEQAPLTGSEQIFLHAMAFSPDGKVLALGFQGVRLSNGVKGTVVELYDVPKRRLLHRLTEPRLKDPDAGKPLSARKSRMIAITSVASSPDGKIVAAGNNDGGIDLWAVADGKKVGHLGNGPISVYQAAPAVGAMQFTAGGKVLVSAEGAQRRVGMNVAGKLHFWDIARSEEIATAGLPSAGYFALSPNGRTLAISQQNGDKWAVEVWDVAKWCRSLLRADSDR
jgi:RNA polymerase sigma factor (sigma-70 family)